VVGIEAVSRVPHELRPALRLEGIQLRADLAGSQGAAGARDPDAGHHQLRLELGEGRLRVHQTLAEALLQELFAQHAQVVDGVA